jgi:hypothetical protein
MAIQDYPSTELEPRNLSKEEMEDPYKVIHSLFDYGHLPQIRFMLWDLLKITITGTYHQQKPGERASLLHFYEKLEKLVEAVHILHRQRDQGQG